MGEKETQKKWLKAKIMGLTINKSTDLENKQVISLTFY